MDYMNKIPVILALLAAIVTGFTSNYFEIENKQIIIRMIIAIIVFLNLGFYLRYILRSIFKERERIKQQQEEEERAASLKESELGDFAENQVNINKNKIDFRVDSDDFTPLSVSKAIKSVIK